MPVAQPRGQRGRAGVGQGAGARRWPGSPRWQASSSRAAPPRTRGRRTPREARRPPRGIRIVGHEGQGQVSGSARDDGRIAARGRPLPLAAERQPSAKHEDLHFSLRSSLGPPMRGDSVSQPASTAAIICTFCATISGQVPGQHGPRELRQRRAAGASRPRRPGASSGWTGSGSASSRPSSSAYWYGQRLRLESPVPLEVVGPGALAAPAEVEDAVAGAARRGT